MIEGRAMNERTICQMEIEDWRPKRVPLTLEEMTMMAQSQQQGPMSAYGGLGGLLAGAIGFGFSGGTCLYCHNPRNR